MSDAKRWISISVEAEHNLEISDVWADGDAPDDVTADDVMQALRDDGYSLRRSLDDWNLLSDLRVVVIIGDSSARALSTAEAYT